VNTYHRALLAAGLALPTGVDLAGANLSWANLHGVDLIDALRGAKK